MPLGFGTLARARVRQIDGNMRVRRESWFSTQILDNKHKNNSGSDKHALASPRVTDSGKGVGTRKRGFTHHQAACPQVTQQQCVRDVPHTGTSDLLEVSPEPRDQPGVPNRGQPLACLLRGQHK